jgi:sulfur carrier protein ThiS
VSTAETPQPDLEQQRAEIAETVEALHAKLDVPTRGKAVVKNQAARLNENTALRNGLIAAVVAAVALITVRRVQVHRRR